MIKKNYLNSTVMCSVLHLNSLASCSQLRMTCIHSVPQCQGIPETTINSCSINPALVLAWIVIHMAYSSKATAASDKHRACTLILCCVWLEIATPSLSCPFSFCGLASHATANFYRIFMDIKYKEMHQKRRNVMVTLTCLCKYEFKSAHISCIHYY